MKKKKKKGKPVRELQDNTGVVWYPGKQTVHKVFPEDGNDQNGLGYIFIEGHMVLVVIGDKLLDMYGLIPVAKFVGDERTTKVNMRYKNKREMT